MRNQLYLHFRIQPVVLNVLPNRPSRTLRFAVLIFSMCYLYFHIVPQGRVIFCSGSPFPPVTINGRTYKPGQGNNAYIFPGVALGVIATLMHHIPDDVFLIAARELASSVRDEDLAVGSLYPPLGAIREVSLKIAVGITKYAYCRGKYTKYSLDPCI